MSMMGVLGRLLLVSAVLAFTLDAGATTLSGGNSKRRDCLLQMQTDALGFPAGASRFKGATCADGDVCDADGTRNGQCRFLTLWCVAQQDAALPQCGPGEVSAVSVRGRIGKGKSGKLDPSEIEAAIAGIGLPTSEPSCSIPVPLDVPVLGPDGRGRFKEGTAKLKARASTSRGKDKDRYRLVCLPAVSVPPSSTSTSTTTSTTIDGTTTSTTLPVLGTPGAGLQAEFAQVTIDPDGTVHASFTLTDDAGVPIIPTTGSTSDPRQARVRLTLARLEVDAESSEGVVTEFTRYVNYITTGAGQPTFDSGGALALIDAASGTWGYTFATTLPAGFPMGLTHTVAAQIERQTPEGTLVANPVFDFVPSGAPVTTIREDSTTAQCNACHNPLAEHGGGRRELRLCQVCHTNQAVDPDTGNTLDLAHMIHRLHHGKELPSIVNGAVGAKYSIIGFGGSEHVYGEKITVCEGGPFGSAPCEVDSDCDGGTCTGVSTAGVGFPRDIRDCAVCHSDGATVENVVTKPSTLSCTGCHDDVNPGETPTEAGSPGTGHLAGDQPEALCRVCHTAMADDDFDLSVPGAHVVPEQSAQLGGATGEILSASGAPGATVTITFRLSDAGGVITDLSGFNRVALAMSGPTTDLGGSSVPVIAPTIAGGGASGALSGPDGMGIFTYETAAMLPGDASGTWRVGLEARRNVSLPDDTPTPGGTVDLQEAIQNPVLDFSVDGSPMVARRTVVADANCATCHGTFSQGFSIHGNLRNRVDYCVICHNPNASDFVRRQNAVASGADPVNEPIALKHLLHKIHTGEELTKAPYIVYGFGSTPHDFSEILFPGDLRDCGSCHVGDSQALPLPAGLLPTAITEVDTSGPSPVEVVIGSVPPIQDACLSCHDSDAAAAHAETNTTVSGAEACTVCHGEGSSEAVSAVHALDP